MSNPRTRWVGLLGILASLSLCVACGSSGGQGPPAARDQFAQDRTADSYPVCGVGLGIPQALDDSPGLENDAYRGAPTPSPIVNASIGAIILKAVPDCKKGDIIQIVPSSAAQIIRRAPSADGLLAGVRIEALVRHFHVIGSGAVPFDQRVDLDCPPKPDKCPADPRLQTQIAHPFMYTPPPG